MTGTVTVTRQGKHRPGRNRFRLAFSVLPGQDFGPYDFAEAIHDLRVSALLGARTARDLVMCAAVNGSATGPVG